MKRRNQKSEPVNPRAAVVRRLLNMAEVIRSNAKITDEADEAIEWEKQLRARAQKLEAEIVAQAA